MSFKGKINSRDFVKIFHKFDSDGKKWKSKIFGIIRVKLNMCKAFLFEISTFWSKLCLKLILLYLISRSLVHSHIFDLFCRFKSILFFHLVLRKKIIFVYMYNCVFLFEFSTFVQRIVFLHKFCNFSNQYNCISYLFSLHQWCILLKIKFLFVLYKFSGKTTLVLDIIIHVNLLAH